MVRSMIVTVALCFSGIASTHAATFVFDTDPFAGSTALTTPGRQIVGGEPSITFDAATDVFVFNPAVFAVSDPLSFINDFAVNIPGSGVNIIVLETLDNDGDPATAFGAGTAANLIASQITADGAGFFIYFNSGLDLPRLVYSTNLNDSTADLKILARMTNLAGNSAGLAAFQADNFLIPEPASMTLLSIGLIGLGLRRRPA